MKYFIILLTFFWSSCSNEADRSFIQEEISIIEVNLDDAAPLHMSEFISEIDYLLLKTPNNEPIGRISKIILTDDFIGLHDEARNIVWIFDHDGDFVNRIHIPHGKGPGSLEHFSDVIITDDQEIHALGAFRINIYNINGELIDQIDMNFLVYGIVYNTEEELYAGYTNNRTNITLSDNHANKNLLFFNKRGNILASSVPIPNGREQMGFSVPNNFPVFNNQVSFFQHLADTVYTVKSDKSYPKYILDYGKNSIPEEVFDRRLNYSRLNYEWLEFRDNEISGKNYVSYLTFFNETESAIFFRIGTDENYYNILFKKDLNETTVGSNRLINDIDYGYVSFIYESSDKALYTYIESIDLIQHLNKLMIEDPEKYNDPATDRLKEVVSKLREDSNPVLQILKLKN